MLIHIIESAATDVKFFPENRKAADQDTAAFSAKNLQGDDCYFPKENSPFFR